MNPTNPSSDPDELFRRATSLHQSGKLTDAAALYKRLLNQFPKHHLLLAGLGTIALQQGNLEEAARLLGLSLDVEPNQPMTHSNRGVALQGIKRLDEAVASYDRAIALKPDYAEACFSRGTVLHELKQLDAALADYDRAIALKPDYAGACFSRGIALQELKRLEEALASYDRTIALKPDYAEAYLNRGITLHDLRRLDEALANYDRAAALKPDYAEAYSNRGFVLQELKRSGEALASCDRAIALKPTLAEAYFNRGVPLQHLKRLDESLASYDRAIALKPDYAEAYWNKSLHKLLTGDFDEGWQLYEWRWKSLQKQSARNFAQSLWSGEQPVAGKTLLIHAEQGLGDLIQFCRYIPMVEALGANIVLEVHASLVSLISTLKGNFTLAEKDKALPSFDLHCPIMSLPLAFKTTLASIPASVPYLHADPGKKEIWHQRITSNTKPKAGLVWSGSMEHKNDNNRSIPLDMLKPLLQLPIEFHALQKEIRPDDAAVLPYLTQIHLHQEELHDFSDTAALIQEMDVVISVDTSVTHLAGAMGKPVWILLPFMPDFRWMLDRIDSPWYPTATLFRQPVAGEWASVITEIAMRLEAL